MLLFDLNDWKVTAVFFVKYGISALSGVVTSRLPSIARYRPTQSDSDVILSEIDMLHVLWSVICIHCTMLQQCNIVN